MKGCKNSLERRVLVKQALWPDALLQINPPYDMEVRVEDLVIEGKLHPLYFEIFRIESGGSLRLFSHLEKAFFAPGT